VKIIKHQKKEGLNINGKIFLIHGLEELIFFKCPYRRGCKMVTRVQKQTA
jgi:hypothetical protein